MIMLIRFFLLITLVACQTKMELESKGLVENNEPVITTSYLKIKVYLGGYYSGGLLSKTMNTLGILPLTHPYSGAPFNHTGTESVDSSFFSTYPEMSDWVLVELRTGLSSATTVTKRAVFVDENGEFIDLNGSDEISFDVAPGSYYVVIKHRNHLSVMTAVKIELKASSPNSLDLTQTPDDVMDADGGVDGLKLLSAGIYGMYAGDTNGDGQVDYKDPGDRGTLLAYMNATAGSMFGIVQDTYTVNDVNGDGDIKYTGAGNDRDTILLMIGGVDPNVVIKQNANIP
jgi:hypothetical protein